MELDYLRQRSSIRGGNSIFALAEMFEGSPNGKLTMQAGANKENADTGSQMSLTQLALLHRCMKSVNSD